MAVKKSELYSSLWKSCDELRGGMDASQYKDCLEYIVVHELAHLLTRKHDERFLALMDRHLPTWQRRRAELNAAPLATEKWSC